MLCRAAVLCVLVVGGCSLEAFDAPSQRVDLDREQTILFRGSEYVTNMRGIAIDASDLRPIGTATLQHTGVIDPQVWALPSVDPGTGIVLRTPPGFDEPGWNITGLTFWIRKGLSGSPPEVCPYWADPTPGCPNWYSSPSPS